jgi:hypothetical protein
MTTGSKGDKLQTWSQIASYLQVSVRTAQLWARNRGLPVQHLAGTRTPVFAFTQELDAWLKAQSEDLVAAESEPAPSPELEGAAAIAPDQSAPVQHEYSTLRVAAAALLCGLLILAAAFSLHTVREVAKIKLDGSELIAQDSRGDELWRHHFDGGINHERYDPKITHGVYWVGDLDGDGHSEVLFPYFPEAVGVESTILYCFGRDGKIKWTYVNKKAVRDSRGEIAPNYIILAVQVLSKHDSSQKLVAVSSARITNEACQIAFLDGRGHVTAEYWHPGHLYLLASIGGGQSGEDRLLAAGTSNGELRATLVVLSPFRMKGMSTPSRVKDQKFRILDMPEAHEDLVILFPRTCIFRDEPYTMAQSLETNEHYTQVVVEMGPAANNTFPSVYFEFAPDFRIRRVYPSNAYSLEHLRLERAGMLNHPSEKDVEMLTNGVEYRWNQ